jgi:hypothetical protein
MQSRRDFLRNRFPRIHKLASGRMREPRMRVQPFCRSKPMRTQRSPSAPTDGALAKALLRNYCELDAAFGGN